MTRSVVMVAPVAAAHCSWFRDKTMTGSFSEDFLQYFVEEQCFLGKKRKKERKKKEKPGFRSRREQKSCLSSSFWVVFWRATSAG